jgi:hypothetical protein
MVATAQAEATAPPDKPRKTTDRRAERIKEFARDALEKGDAYQATVRAATADLLDIGYGLAVNIKAIMGQAPMGSADYEDIAPALATLLQVDRQIGRFGQLDLQITAANDPGRKERKNGRRPPGDRSEEMKI